MSRLAEFRAAEKALQEQLLQLEALKKDSGLKREIEFEQKLVSLMKKYDKGLREIIDILDPGAATRRPQSAPKTRRARVVKVYENPHTGERIETKGGNHHGLKAWKQEYGAQTVDSWLLR
ncbi:histone-like nucleoid-structuring protein, MvaT/MvaU family [Pseudomonas brassicae]|uniref:histone-like nucleoid-structuring protein, MvaT/MvaU family n=1 Tax=Pseudomonas brassicae TaxID=2708063 RepID=UPI0030829453